MNANRQDKSKPASKTGSRQSKPATRAIKEPSIPDLSRLLVPIDFSEESREALQRAAALAAEFGSTVDLVHIVPTTLPTDLMALPLIMSNERHEQDVLGMLSGLAESSLPAGNRGQAMIRKGVPWHEIVSAAEELGTKMIVIPTHGRSGLKHALMGSTAERVVRHAPCAVWVVRD